MPSAGRLGWLIAAGVLALAAASVLLPFSAVYDPWAWLVWGRELTDGSLDTSGGPSFKPLPVAICALLAPFGEAAPDAWLAVARVGWLAAPLLGAWLVLMRVGPSRSDQHGLRAGVGRGAAVAGAALAAGSIALTHDAFTPSVRQFSGGLSEPLLVALVLGAVAAELCGRPRVALGLALAASLIRPEAWPFAIVYGVVAVRRDRRLRVPVIAGALMIPLAWFLPELLSTGDPVTGAEIAREGSGSPPVEALEVVGRALIAPLAAVWVGLVLLVSDWRCRGGAPEVERVLLIGALAWIGLVAIMAAFGYAGLPRFFAPATGVLSVLAGIGVARALAVGRGASGAADSDAPRASRGSALPKIAVAVLVLGAGGLALRIGEVPGEVREATEFHRSVEDLFVLEDRVGRETFLSCRDRTTVSDLLIETALAWQLDAALSDVGSRPRPRRGVVVIPARRPTQGEEVARAGEWAAVRLRC